MGHASEVRLRDGTTLRGRLVLNEEWPRSEIQRDFTLPLRIGRCTFTPAEIEACVRID